MAWWCHMATWIWVKIGSGNGLLPDGIKSLPEPMLTNHQWDLVAFSQGQFHRKWSRYISPYDFEIIILRLLPHLPAANEIIQIQLGLIITWCTITGESIKHLNGEGNTQVKIWILKSHHIPCPHRLAMRCLLWIFWKIWPSYDSVKVYSLIGTEPLSGPMQTYHQSDIIFFLLH